jgi:hypothetical protein
MTAFYNFSNGGIGDADSLMALLLVSRADLCRHAAADEPIS